jgi:hypothetical protein
MLFTVLTSALIVLVLSISCAMYTALQRLRSIRRPAQIFLSAFLVSGKSYLSMTLQMIIVGGSGCIKKVVHCFGLTREQANDVLS